MRLAALAVTSAVLAGGLGATVATSGCSGDDGAGAHPQCTGTIYQACHDEHDCADGLCRPFDGGIYCTQSCTPGDDSTCPKLGGEAATCNASSLCEVAMPDGCILGMTDG